MHGYAVGETAYVEDLYYATDLLKTSISLGLHHEFIIACQRSPQISEIVHGLHAREDEGLCVFKDSIGFPVSQIPCRVCINPLVAGFLRWRHSDRYYRLSGDTG